MKPHTHPTLLLALGLLLLAACGGEGSGEAKSAAPRATLAFAAEKPAGAILVAEARTTLQAGDPAVITGQIGGALSPFTEGYAGFVLADPTLVFCNEMEEPDHCPTPWDACCEDPEKLQTNRVAVQFVDAAGNPVPGGLKGVNDLSELDTVTVTGTISADSTAENMILHAATLHRHAP